MGNVIKSCIYEKFKMFTCAMYGRRPLKDVNVLAIHAHQGEVWVTRWVYKSYQIYIDLRAYHHVDVHW